MLVIETFEEKKYHYGNLLFLSILSVQESNSKILCCLVMSSCEYRHILSVMYLCIYMHTRISSEAENLHFIILFVVMLLLYNHSGFLPEKEKHFQDEDLLNNLENT